MLLWCFSVSLLLHWLQHVASPVWFHTLLISIICNWNVKLASPKPFVLVPGCWAMEERWRRQQVCSNRPASLCVILPHHLILSPCFFPGLTPTPEMSLFAVFPVCKQTCRVHYAPPSLRWVYACVSPTTKGQCSHDLSDATNGTSPTHPISTLLTPHREAC